MRVADSNEEDARCHRQYRAATDKIEREAAQSSGPPPARIETGAASSSFRSGGGLAVLVHQSWLAQPLRAAEHALPVEVGENSLIEMPGTTGRLGTVEKPPGKRRHQLAAVTKLCQHDLAPLNRQWTGSVT